MRQRQVLERTLSNFRRIERDLEDNLTLIEMGEAEGDASAVAEGEALLAALARKVKSIVQTGDAVWRPNNAIHALDRLPIALL